MQFLKQEHAIDIKNCLDRGGKWDVIACMEESLFIGKMAGTFSGARNSLAPWRETRPVAASW